MANPSSIQHLRHPDMRDPLILHRIADRLRDRLGAERVILYGSVARGDATVHSDIDLLVVAPTSEKGYVRMAKARAAIRDLSRGLPISPLVLTPEELRAGTRGGDGFLEEIQRTGVDL